MYPYDDNIPEKTSDNNSSEWDSPSSSCYNFTYSQPSAPESTPPTKKKRGRNAARVVALVLCCALVGGGAGVGGAAIFNRAGDASSGSAASEEESDVVLYQSTTDYTSVAVKEVDGVTEMSLGEIYDAYVDACVCIEVEAIETSGMYQYSVTGVASGFIVSEDGYIVTNYHVIDGATSISVTLNNGEVYPAKLIGGEELSDVAVIKIDGITGLTPVVLGNSDTLSVGDEVSTIGNALGRYSFSQTSGTVSATSRSVSFSTGVTLNVIQTDCVINSGNSGGPLFDSYGRVVGITTGKSTSGSSSTDVDGITFCIPINDVIDLITDFIEYGYVTGRPYLGITSNSSIDETYQQVFGWPAGVYVNSVEEGSCAETAGVRQGDIITMLGDTEVTSLSELTAAKNTYRAGDTTTITVYRSGEYLTLTVTFDEQISIGTSDDDTEAETEEPEVEESDPEPTETSSSGYSFWPFY